MKTKIYSLIFFMILFSCGDDPISFAEQLDKDLKAIDAYLVENGIVAEADEGDFVRYVVHDFGIGGSSPLRDQCVRVNYVGKLLKDASDFDEGENVRFRLDQTIPGWQIGLPLIYEGDSITLYVPSGLGYGNSRVGSVPPNSNLIFGIRLIGASNPDPSSGLCR